jgi:hypothetical protein
MHFQQSAGLNTPEVIRENHVYHELMVKRFTLVTQVGVTISKRYIVAKWYGRFGMRIDITRNFFVRGILKIPNAFKADFIE